MTVNFNADIEIVDQFIKNGAYQDARDKADAIESDIKSGAYGFESQSGLKVANATLYRATNRLENVMLVNRIKTNMEKMFPLINQE